ncbi:MAG: 6-phosphogluconolactonase [Methylococcales bacterium]|nr:6-phosphogluconolactonase [Methylococcales bacterium]MBT7445384.1 6-phosphogluconolactonase [Methylococcales bacterium]
MADLHWETFPDANAVAQETVQRVLKSAEQAIAERGVFKLVLAGGRTPEAAYKMLVEQHKDFSKWEIYYGDERCLPVENAERNSKMAHDAWLKDFDFAGIFPIPAELGSATASAQYSETIKAAMPFDIVLLGIGEDGHTASLFPGHVHDTTELTHAVADAPKPPSDRVSLSAASLGNSKAVYFLITGSGKIEAVQGWKAGKDLPVATIKSASGVTVLIDEDANASA